MQADKTLTIALPKGRILDEVMPLMKAAGIQPEPAFFDENSRQLRFATSDPAIMLIRVRSFDAATFVAYGAAQLGVAGSDVLMECDLADIYAPLDLGIGKCRLSVAAHKDFDVNTALNKLSHVRVATKYPNLTQQHFASKGIQAECIKLNGAMELAPLLGLSPMIVDLVSTGKTLQENNLVEVEKILDVSSRLIINRTAFKTQSDVIHQLLDRFKNASLKEAA